MRLWAVILASAAALLMTVYLMAEWLAVRKFGPLPNEAAALVAGCVVIYQERFALNGPLECEDLQASLEGEVWTITGPTPPEGVLVGGPVIELSKTDGRVIRFYQTAG